MTPDLILADAAVFTVDPDHPRADAVAISGDRIQAVGTAAEIEALAGPKTELLRLEGRSLLPGFQDAHVHPPIGGLTLMRCNLDGYETRGAVLDAVASYARAHPDDPWILGGAWWPSAFVDRPPTAHELDQVTGGRPAYLPDVNGHTGWANSAAMRLAGVGDDTPDPSDGTIGRDADGRANGIFEEGAMYQITRHIPRTTPEENIASLLTGQEYLHSVGITAWQDASVGHEDWGDTLDAYPSLAADGRLTGRVVGALWWFFDKGDEQVADFVAARERTSGGRFRATTVKLMHDGSLINGTAQLREPYLDLAGALTDNRGLRFVEPEDLARICTSLDREGFQLHFHSIGDAATRDALDAIAVAQATNGVRDARHTISHLQVVHPDDVPRFAALGVVPNAQPLWGARDPESEAFYFPVLGKARIPWVYRQRSFLDAGARLAFGSDWNVSTADPFQQMHVAVHRRYVETPDAEPLTPEEGLTLEQAVEAFTMGSAYVNHLDRETGSITPGKFADLCIADRDLFDRGAGEIGQVRAALTMVGGQVVFSDRSIDR